MYCVAGTQAASGGSNKLMVLKLSDLGRTTQPDSDASDEENSEEEGEPILEFRSFHHTGGINRVKSMPQEPQIVASWSENKKVYIWDCGTLLSSLDGHPSGKNFLQCVPNQHTAAKCPCCQIGMQDFPR